MAGLAAYAWMHRSTPGTGTFAVLMSAVSLWAFFVVLELLSPDGRSILLLVKFEYVLIAGIPPTVLVFALRYSGRREWLVPSTYFALALIPVTTVILMWTNSSHGLIWHSYDFVRDGAFLLQDITYGLWFWINSSFAYLLMVVASVVLAMQAASLTQIYRRQAMGIVLGISLPWLSNLVYVFRLSPIAHLDLTPLGFMAGGIVVAWAMFRYRLLDLAPVARDKLVENARDVMFVVDDAGRVSDINRAALDLLETSASEVLGRSAGEVLDFWGQLESTVAHVDRTGVSLNASLSVSHRNRHYDVRISPLKPTSQGTTGFLVVLRDISAYRRAQELQRALYQISEAANSSQDLQSLYAQVHQIVGGLIPAENLFIALYDEQTDIISCPYHVDTYDPVPAPGSMSEWSDTLTALLISTGEPLLVSSEDDRNTIRSLGVNNRGTVSCCWLGVPLRTGDSTTIGALVVQSYRDEDRYREQDKAVLSFVSTQIAMAIDRKRAQEALRTSEEHFRSIFQGAGMGIAILASDDGRFLDVNPALENWLGYSSLELKEMCWPDVTCPDDVEQPVQIWNNSEGVVTLAGNYEYRCLRKDGQAVWGLVTVSPLGQGEAGAESAICMVQDITPLRHAEEERATLLAQYLQAQKMEAIGRLTAGIAHDFNNLLTVINGYAERVRMALPAEHPLQESVSRIAQSGWRAAELIHRLLIFSRKSIADPQILDVNVTVNETEQMLRRVIGEDVDLTVSLANGIWLANLDPTQFEQILFNLVVNARDAMPSGGKLDISTQNRVVSTNEASMLGPDFAAGEYVVLAVRDTGMGMSEEVRGRIFEPFFTTKEEGIGTGLGLATVQEIVAPYNGFVSVDSVVGEGTVFQVFIPRCCAQGEMDNTGDKDGYDAAEYGGTETILVVEDDQDMREVILQTLEDRGYSVLTADSAAEALALEETLSVKIDLLLADVILPGMNGRALADEIARKRKNVKVVLMSGYVDEIVRQYGVAPGEMTFLKKPFGPQELVVSVRTVLDQ